MSGVDPGRIGGRAVEVCISFLLAAMALYGAVSIMRAIWVYLCIGVLIVSLGAFIWWRISTHLRGW